jgi:hypothetical protein
LGMAHQGYEWYTRMIGNPVKDNESVLSGDYKEATDHIDHHPAKLIMSAFYEGAGIESPYIRGFTNLLLSGRLVEPEGVHTMCGSLMGEPGTKIVLTILGKVINKAACRNPDAFRSRAELQKDRFATAGDDTIDAGPLKVLKRFKRYAQRTGLIPSPDKWGIYGTAAPYCENLICFRMQFISAYEDGFAALGGYIDYPKIRLTSSERKPQKGEEDTNPVFGKAKMLVKMLQWCPNWYPDFKHRMFCLFLRNMRNFILKGYQTFTPEEWGGLGIPCRQRLLETQMAPWHKALIALREKGDDVAAIALRRWGTMTVVDRGLDTNSLETKALYMEELALQGLEPIDPLTIPALTGKVKKKDQFEELAHLGYKTREQILTLIISAQTYTSYYDVEVKAARGYNVNRPFAQRTSQLEHFAKQRIEKTGLSVAEILEGFVFPVTQNNDYPKPSTVASPLYLVRGRKTPEGIPLGLEKKIPGPRCFTETRNGVLLGWLKPTVQVPVKGPRRLRRDSSESDEDR